MVIPDELVLEDMHSYVSIVLFPWKYYLKHFLMCCYIVLSKVIDLFKIYKLYMNMNCIQVTHLNMMK